MSALYSIRVWFFRLVLVGSATLLIAVLVGRVHLFTPAGTSVETLTVACYLLSSLVQGLSAILAVTITVLFLAALIYARERYARILAELYRDGTTLVVLGIYTAAIALGAISLSRVSLIVSTSAFLVLDVNLVAALAALALLVPLVLGQLEHINPYLLAAKLAKRITIRRVLEYRLSDVWRDPQSTKVNYVLHVFGYQHGRDDPLAPFHEVVLWAVQNRDRVAMSSLIRLLLRVAADALAVPYAPVVKPTTLKGAQVRRRLHLLVYRPRSEEQCVAVALFVLTYVVRRAQRLREEWGHLDIVRQQYILNILDLIRAAIWRPQGAVVAEVCLYASMHICLAYRMVLRYGEEEALRHYFILATELDAAGDPTLTLLCCEIIGLLAEQTRQIPEDLLRELEDALPDPLRAQYEAARRSATDPEWLPGTPGRDPWRYRIAAYGPSAERRILVP